MPIHCTLSNANGRKRRAKHDEADSDNDRVAALDGAAIVALRPHPQALAHHLVRAGTWIAREPDAALAQLAGAALWLVAAWLGAGLLAALLAHLPGVAGAVARRIAAVALPRVLQRVVVGSLGAGIVLAPVAASAAAAPSPPIASPTSTAVPSPVWPSSPPASTPAPRWPVSTPRAHPAPPRPAPPAHRPAPAAPTGTPVRVHAGDTLWRLAADRLGPASRPHRVTHYWQRIYAANRAVIGGDPDRIHPGQQLVLPAPTAEELP